MRYIVILLLAMVAVWYFFLRTEAPPPPPVAVAPPTPEQQFQTLLSGRPPVDAAKLGELCNAYPQLAARLLKDRPFNITGTISNIRLSGLDERRVELTLISPGTKQITVLFDLDKYVRQTVAERAPGKFAIIGPELLWVSRSGANEKRLLATTGEAFRKYVTLKNIGLTAFVFEVSGQVMPELN